jgi:hypothetical protein
MAGKAIRLSIRLSIHPLRRLADYNFSGPLNAAMKVIQKLDDVGKLGERGYIFRSTKS